MKLTAPLENRDQLPLFRSLGVSEVLIGHRDLSRFGQAETSEVTSLIQSALEFGLRPVVEWDILMTEEALQKALALLRDLPLSEKVPVRVQDPGALQAILELSPQVPIQLNLESGHHNWEAIDCWRSYVGSRLDKLILSLEIPKERLRDYVQKLRGVDGEENNQCHPGPEVEILGLGRLLLFYSPRSLLSPLAFSDSQILQDADQEHGEMPFTARDWAREIRAKAKSEESPHKGFYLLENQHGTFMFHPKEIFLLEHLRELQEMGLSSLRLDFRFGKSLQCQREILQFVNDFFRGMGHLGEGDTEVAQFQLQWQEKLRHLKSQYPAEVFQGFFHVNKTDVLFSKLKNTHLAKRDERFLGEILEVEKGRYAAIWPQKQQHDLKVSDRVEVLTPKGEVIPATITELRNSRGERINEAPVGKVVLMNYVKGMVPRSILMATTTP